MQCLKCGRETQEQVFCQSCLDDMAKAPVKPGTPVVIFERSNKKRKATPQKVDPEETIQKLNRTVRRLKIWLCVFGSLFVLAAGAAGYLFFSAEQKPPIGQNYSTVIDTSPSTE